MEWKMIWSQIQNTCSTIREVNFHKNQDPVNPCKHLQCRMPVLRVDSNWYLLTLRVKKIFCDFKNNLAPIVLHLLRGTLFCNKRWILRQFCRSSHLGVCRVSITHECCICSTFSGKENFPFPLYSIYLVCCFPSKVKWRSMTLMFSKCWSKKGSILKTLNIGRQGVF